MTPRHRQGHQLTVDSSIIGLSCDITRRLVITLVI